MHKAFVLLTFIVLASGCTQLQMLPYLDQLLLLKSFGIEKDGQQKYVASMDTKFDKMLAQIQSGEIKKYKTERDIISAFGPAILANTVMMDGQVLKQCLYRYVIQKTGPHKVYMYYDRSGRLVRFESI